MVLALQKSRPVVLSRFDLPDAPELMVHSCEDCACPVRQRDRLRPCGTGQSDVIDEAGQWVRAREIVEVHVDQEHRALFNPLGQGGVVVVNQAAHEIYNSFTEPATFKDVRTGWPGDGDGADQISRRLSHLEIIHRARPHPAGRVRCRARSGQDADRVAARDQRLQPALPVLLRGEVRREDG